MYDLNQSKENVNDLGLWYSVDNVENHSVICLKKFSKLISQSLAFEHLYGSVCCISMLHVSIR